MNKIHLISHLSITETNLKIIFIIILYMYLINKILFFYIFL